MRKAFMRPLMVLMVLLSLASMAMAAAPSVVTYAVHADPMVFWDPAETWAAEIKVFQNIYESLVRIIPGQPDQFIPVLAESWEESADKLSWRFKLRKGVKFHSGLDMNAHVAAESLNRTIKGNKGAVYIFDGVKEIQALDDYTLEFLLERPLPMLYIVSSGYGSYIYNPEHPREWYYSINADGTGPYKLNSYKKDAEIILERFDGYWRGWRQENPAPDFAVVKVVKEQITRRQLLTKGDVDIVDTLGAEVLEPLKQDENISISRTPSYQQLTVFLNTKKPPLDNKKVRQALAYLMPYDDVVNFVMKGQAVQARGVVPPNLWGHSEDLFQYNFDPEKAKALLAEAGYPDGGFKLLYTYTAGDQNIQKVGELFKDSLAKAGIELELRGMTVDSKYNLAKATDPLDRQDITTLYWWPDNVDPQGYFVCQFHSEEQIGYNFGYYSNAEVDKLIDEAVELSGVSIEKAVEKYIRAQEIILEDCPAIMVYCDEYVRPYRKNLGGYVDNPAYPETVFFYDLFRIN
jgi:peptide/nickel transport system substrate-binding protein